jgi:predicted ABC-type ATPase
LYYVATENPEINVDRVNYRVNFLQEHSVPEDKIRSRYARSLALLPRAILYSNRAFFFDTSEDKPWYFAKSTAGQELELTGDEMPVWFNPIWDQF